MVMMHMEIFMRKEQLKVRLLQARDEVSLFGSKRLFADAGRGWRVGARDNGLTYSRTSFPPLSTFRSDIGFGLDIQGMLHERLDARLFRS